MDFRKQYESLQFKDDFMFGAVMRDIHIAKKVLCVILAEEIPDIEYCEIQKVVKNSVASHGVRYDVYIKTPDGTKVYNIEMQTTNHYLQKRSRYYLSSSDIDFLSEGKPYTGLPQTYIIFICPFDLFGRNKAVYKFENYCVEENIPLCDESYHIFVNTAGTTPRKELQNLMDYINTNIPNDDLTAAIQNKVRETRHDDMLFSTYLHQQQEQLLAEAKGRAEGRIEGVLKTLVQLVKDGILTLSEAAKRADMTTDDFKLKTGLVS